MKKTYLVRVTTYAPIEDMNINKLAHKILSTGLPIRNVEVFDEEKFVDEVYEKSGLNEIDVDVLLQDILHIAEEEVNKYMGWTNEV